MGERTRMINPDEIVPVQWRPSDFKEADIMGGAGLITYDEWFSLPQVRGVNSITKGQIEKFCESCDLCRDDLVCKTEDGLPFQTRSVARQWCPKAIVNGVAGEISEQGFNPIISKHKKALLVGT